MGHKSLEFGNKEKAKREKSAFRRAWIKHFGNLDGCIV